jgi:hypothetical protein
MPPRGIRFRPPPVEVSAELGWALARAFGPLEICVPPPADAGAALAAARRFEIAARIAARLPKERWEAELGESGATELRRERIGAVAAEVRLIEVARGVAETAGEMGVPVALLKFAALSASGAAAPGSRPACDVDLLAQAAGAAELHGELRRRGWKVSELPSGDHQMGALASPAGVVELHLHLPGVRIAGRSARFEDLERAALLIGGLPGWPAACRLPARDLLIGHALAHGIAQHGFAPHAYGQLKMIGDLVDLGFAAEDEGRVREMIGADVSAAEIAAARKLAAALAAGEDLRARLAEEEAGEILLLRHVIAGRQDDGYRAALKLGLRPQPGDARRAVAAARAAWSTVFLSRAQVDAIYGRPASGWGYLGRRLARPFDLVRRLAGYAAAARRGRHILPRP